MKLMRVLQEALAEQDPPGSENLIEFPKANVTISIDRAKKKLIFSPQDNTPHHKPMLRTLLVMLKQEFQITKVRALEDEGDATTGDQDDPALRGVFEVEIDPRTDLEAVIEFIKNEIARG